MKSIKTSISTRLAALLFGAALFGLVTQSALAAGTASGTSITNSASLGYTVSGVAQTPVPSNVVSFLVDNKVNMTVARVDLAPVGVVSGAATVNAVTTFTVTNNGNTSQDFALAALDMANGTANPFGGVLTDSFVASACTISNIVVVGAGSMGAYTAGDQFINALTPDSGATVSVTCTIPANQANGTLAVVSLTATAYADNAANTLGAALVNSSGAADIPGTVQIVFADTVAGPAVGDIPLNGANSILNAYLIQSATLSVTKTATPICDPADGNVNPKNIPGAAVRYAITIANTGAAAATLSTLTDNLVAQLTFDTRLNSGALPATNCVNGNVANSLSASGFGAVRGVGVGPGVIGVATDATTAGATAVGQAITINFGALASPNYGVANSSLAAGSYITVYFNAFVN